MTLAGLRAFALGLPQATVIQQWGEVLVFKVGGKMFLLIPFEGSLSESMSFKPEEDRFEELAGTDGLRPAPYLARARWVQVEDMDAFSAATLQGWIRMSHRTVVAGLSKKKRAELGL